MLQRTDRSETRKPHQSVFVLLVLGCLAYRGRVVGECLQVSDIGVDQPPRALDVQAHVVIGSVGDDHSHTERYQSRPAEGGIDTFTVTCHIYHKVCLHF